MASVVEAHPSEDRHCADVDRRDLGLVGVVAATWDGGRRRNGWQF